MIHTAKLDQIVDQVQDLLVVATEEGFDDAATTLENILEHLNAVQFAESGEEDA